MRGWLSDLNVFCSFWEGLLCSCRHSAEGDMGVWGARVTFKGHFTSYISFYVCSFVTYPLFAFLLSRSPTSGQNVSAAVTVWTQTIRFVSWACSVKVGKVSQLFSQSYTAVSAPAAKVRRNIPRSVCMSIIHISMKTRYSNTCLSVHTDIRVYRLLISIEWANVENSKFVL